MCTNSNKFKFSLNILQLLRIGLFFLAVTESLEYKYAAHKAADLLGFEIYLQQNTHSSQQGKSFENRGFGLPWSFSLWGWQQMDTSMDVWTIVALKLIAIHTVCVCQAFLSKARLIYNYVSAN